MKRFLAILHAAIPLLFATFGASVLLLGPVVVGCSTTQTQEAKAFFSFKDTWSIARAAYDRYAERVVQGQVSKAAEQDADAAWQIFRESFKIALVAAQQNQSTTAPEQVRVNANEFIAATKRL